MEKIEQAREHGGWAGGLTNLVGGENLAATFAGPVLVFGGVGDGHDAVTAAGEGDVNGGGDDGDEPAGVFRGCGSGGGDWGGSGGGSGGGYFGGCGASKNPPHALQQAPDGAEGDEDDDQAVELKRDAFGQGGLGGEESEEERHG